MQLEKALLPIEITPSGITIDVNAEHPLNAYSPILTTLPGMDTEVKLSVPLSLLYPQVKALIPIFVTPSLITIVRIKERMVYHGIVSSKVVYSLW